MTAVSDTVTTHGRQITTLQTTIEEQGQDARSTRTLLEQMAASMGIGGDGPPPEPAGPGAALFGAPPPRARDGPTAVASQHVDAAAHIRILGLLNVGTGRGDMTTLATEISQSPNATMPFGAWWKEVAKTQGLAQWRMTLQSLGCQQAAANAITHPSRVGEAIFARLKDSGEWHDSDIQNITI